VREIWKPVVGYETHYQVSNMGRVKRIKAGPSTKAGRILKPGKSKKGYLSVGLCKDGLQRAFSIHRLVLIAFKGSPQNKEQASHLNGIKSDNKLVNLTFMTQSENINYGQNFLGEYRGVSGEEHCCAKLTSSKVRKIRKLRKNGMKYKEISKLFPVTIQNIHYICKQKTWRHI